MCPSCTRTTNKNSKMHLDFAYLAGFIGSRTLRIHFLHRYCNISVRYWTSAAEFLHINTQFVGIQIQLVSTPCVNNVYKCLIHVLSFMHSWLCFNDRLCKESNRWKCCLMVSIINYGVSLRIRPRQHTALWKILHLFINTPLYLFHDAT